MDWKHLFRITVLSLVIALLSIIWHTVTGFSVLWPVLACLGFMILFMFTEQQEVYLIVKKEDKEA